MKTSPAQLRAQAKYQSKPEQIKKREGRNRARYAMEQAGKVSKGDGRDVDHVKYDAQKGADTQIRVVPASVNRSRNKHGGKKK